MKLILTSLCLLILTHEVHALPIDWNGVLAFDTTTIYNYRRLEKKSDDSNFGNSGSLGTQEVPLGAGNDQKGNWQSYIFRLEPSIIINDAATIKSEFSTGYGRGGRVGDSAAQAQQAGFANSLYPYSFSDGNDSIVVNKLFAKIYSDTATYTIGRHSTHYGLGAVINSGDNTWDRFSFIRDGVSANIKLSSFNIEPFWARVSSDGSLTKATRIKEYGISLVYDSIERDMSFGLLYSKKKSALFNSEFKKDLTGAIPDPSTGTYTGSTLERTDVKLIDVFFKKTFGKVNLALEVPILSGKVGNVFGPDTKYKAKAIVFETDINLNNKWRLGFNGGQVSGDDGNGTSFDAMYLNPNYQIANLMFRYNLRAISSQDGNLSANVYDSYINNAFYLKTFATYKLEKWTWDMAFIWAKADQVARAGSVSYNHLTNKTFTANFNQEDDLGMEIDLDFNYQWNNEINVGGSLGYLFTGDYYGYNNSATPNKVTNSYLFQLNTSIAF